MTKRYAIVTGVERVPLGLALDRLGGHYRVISGIDRAYVIEGRDVAETLESVREWLESRLDAHRVTEIDLSHPIMRAIPG